MPSNYLTEAHKEILRKSAIDPERALHWGITSVEMPEDLPRGTEELATHVPGILFPIPDPFNNKSFQLRADNAGENFGKYRFIAGDGASLACWPSMNDMISGNAEYSQVVIVEGTKQCLALASLKPPHTLVVGIAGCWGWKNQEEDDAAVDELDRLVAGKNVYVLFDADIRTNENVNQAAKALQEYLTQTISAPAKEVRWIALGDAKNKEGIDDFLGKVPAPERLKEFNRLRARAAKKVPSMQDQRRTQLQGLNANEDMRAFTKVSYSKDGDIVNEEVAFNALVRITESMTVVNDLIRQPDGSPKHLGVRVTLEVSSPVLGDQSSYISVPYDELRDFESWVQRLPRGAAASILIPAPGRPTNDLVNAIKMYRADEREVVNGYARLGWIMHNGQPHYLYSGGAIGPDGNTTSVRGVLEGPASKVRFRDLTEVDDQLKEAVRASLSPIAFLHHPELWKTLVGAAAYVGAGFEPKGMLFFFGEPGSGKTHLAQGATSFFSPDYAPGHEIMASLEGTDNAITSLTIGFHNAFLLFDDAHPVKNLNKRDRQYDMIDSLSRIGYSGGSVGKMRGRWDNRTQSIKQAEVSSDRPFIMITAEFQPYGDDARSQLERMFLIRIRRDDTFLSLAEMEDQVVPGLDETMSGAKALETLGEKGVFNDAMAGFLRWIANRITEYSSDEDHMLERWRLDKLRELSDGIKGDFKDDGTRLVENVRTYLVGWIMWLEYAADIGAISHTEALDLLNSYRAELMDLKEQYTTSALDTTSYGFGQLVNEIQARRAAGELVIARSWSDREKVLIPTKANAVTVGAYVKGTKTHGEGVALSIPLLAQALHQDKVLIAQMLDRNGVNKNHVFKLNDQSIRGWFFPRELWEKTIEEGEASLAPTLSPSNTDENDQ